MRFILHDANSHFLIVQFFLIFNAEKIAALQFAICHGPQLLISADVIRGRKLTAVKPIVVDVKNAGGEFYDQEVVVDNEQLVTSRTPDDLPAFNREALRLLGAGITPPV